MRLNVVLIFIALLSACTQVKLDLVDGETRALSSYQGDWLLINYWAVWCKPCVEEIPELNDLARQKGITVLGYNFDGSKGEELEFQRKKLNIQFPLLAIDPAIALELKKPTVLPATIIIDPEGNFKTWLFGPQTKQSIQTQINKIKRSVEPDPVG